MGLMDAFNPEATTEIKVGELYEMLQQAAENAQTAKFLLNGVKNEVPYKYIREIVTGEEVEHYHFLAGETKTDLEHIAYELGVLNGSQLSKKTLLEHIITQERKAGGEA